MPDSCRWVRGRIGDAITAKSPPFHPGRSAGFRGSVGRRTKGRRLMAQQTWPRPCRFDVGFPPATACTHPLAGKRALRRAFRPVDVRAGDHSALEDERLPGAVKYTGASRSCTARCNRETDQTVAFSGWPAGCQRSSCSAGNRVGVRLVRYGGAPGLGEVLALLGCEFAWNIERRQLDRDTLEREAVGAAGRR